MKDNQRDTWKEKLQYQFDCIMSKGMISIVKLLFWITLIVVILIGILLSFVVEEDISVIKSIWISLMHTIDAGTIAADEGNFIYMLLMSIVTLCGIFITSILIGAINNGMTEKLESLRRGKSRIIEKDHVVILGFNNEIFTIIQEIIKANSNHNSVIVILDHKHTVEEMEDRIHQRIADLKTIRVICRMGNVYNTSEISVCSIDTCKSIIINVENDYVTIKSILAVRTLLDESDNKNAYIVAVIKKKENLKAAEVAGGGRAEILYLEEVIARIIAQSSRHVGIPRIFTELFNFDGSEFYIESGEKVLYKSMVELNLFYPNSIVVGIHRGNKSFLCPPMDMRVEKGDKLIVLAEDDMSSVPNQEPGKYDKSVIHKQMVEIRNVPRKVLILRYSSKLEIILREEDLFLPPKSVITIAVSEKYRVLLESIDMGKYTNIEIRVCYGSIYEKDFLESMITEAQPDTVLVLSKTTMELAEEEDAKILFLLLQLRNLYKELRAHFSITSEMQYIENQKLAKVTEVKDFIVGSDITNLIVSQISQTRELSNILKEIIDTQGADVYLRPVEKYIKCDKKVNIYTAGVAVARKNEVLIGYCKNRVIGNKEYDIPDIIINPPKEREVVFRKGDNFIVLAIQ